MMEAMNANLTSLKTELTAKIDSSNSQIEQLTISVKEIKLDNTILSNAIAVIN